MDVYEMTLPLIKEFHYIFLEVVGYLIVASGVMASMWLPVAVFIWGAE